MADSQVLPAARLYGLRGESEGWSGVVLQQLYFYRAEVNEQEAERLLESAVSLDRRRQQQITNQIKVINRLLDGATYDQVFGELMERLVEAQTLAADLERQLAMLRAAYAAAGYSVPRTDT